MGDGFREGGSVMEEMRQIKPKSVLDPVQIKPETGGDGENETKSSGNEGVIGIESGTMKKKRVRKLAINWGGRRLKIIGGAGLAIGLVMIFLVVLPMASVYRRGKGLVAQGRLLEAAFEQQDIGLIEGELIVLEEKLSGLEKSYNRVAWMRVVPVVGAYWKDGKAGINAGKYGIEAAELVIETVKPYADIIGFAGGEGEEAKSGEETANDRIEFLVQTVEEITPKMDEISEAAAKANSEINKINPDRYPKELRGVEVRNKLKRAIEMANEGTAFLAESKPLMEAAPYLLGMESTRKYLVLFQNDKELRPTGGFITAYSIMNVHNGKLQPVSSDDIYHLDNNYKPVVDAPEVYQNYIKGPYALTNKLRLRDMNWSPDFGESMKLFLREAGEAGIDEVDGVIAVDTQVVVYLLDVIGKIGVPGFGNFSTEIVPECDCPQVIYELESFADIEGPVVWSENEPGKIVYAPPNYDNRKKIVGPLMNSVIANALGQEKGKLPDLFMAGWKMVTEKHVLVYLFDEEAQRGAEGFNMAGKIEDYEGDYLHINDANLGGRKSNLYVTQEVNQEVDIKRDGTVEKTVTITYKNPKEQDGWLNSVLPNWTRIYVPQGSELVSTEGFEDQEEPYEELGKTVFAGGFELRPLGVKKIVVKYKLPFKVKGDYRLMIQKQPGLDRPLYTVNLGKKTEEFFLKTDREIKIGI